MLSTAVIVFLCMKFINRTIAKKTNELYSQRDRMTENFANIVDNRSLSQDLDIKDQLHENYFEKVASITETYTKRTKLKSLRDNLLYLAYNLIVFLCSLYIIKLVADDFLTVTLYLVLVP